MSAKRVPRQRRSVTEHKPWADWTPRQHFDEAEKINAEVEEHPGPITADLLEVIKTRLCQAQLHIDMAAVKQSAMLRADVRSLIRVMKEQA